MPILPSGSRMRPIHAAWVCRAERRSGRRTGRPDMFAQHILGRAFVNYGRVVPRHRRGRACPSRRPTRASHPHSGAKTIDSTRGGRTPHSSARHSADRATRHVDDPGHWPPPRIPTQLARMAATWETLALLLPHARNTAWRHRPGSIPRDRVPNSSDRGLSVPAEYSRYSSTLVPCHLVSGRVPP
jgi:hypothetical protein